MDSQADSDGGKLNRKSMLTDNNDFDVGDTALVANKASEVKVSQFFKFLLIFLVHPFTDGAKLI